MDTDFESVERPATTPWRRMLFASLLLHALLLLWPALMQRPTPGEARWSGLDVRLAPAATQPALPRRATAPARPAPAPPLLRPTLPSVPARAPAGSGDAAILAPAETSAPAMPAATPGPPRVPQAEPGAEPTPASEGTALSGQGEATRRQVIRDTARELESTARQAQREGRGTVHTPRALEAILRDRLARPEAYREIALGGGETMIQLPEGGCMLTSGPPNGLQPFETRLVTFTTPDLDARCPH